MAVKNQNNNDEHEVSTREIVEEKLRELIKEEAEEKFREKLSEEGVEISYDEMSYDDLVNEIIENSDETETLFLIAEGVRLNPNLTDYQKNKLIELIEKEMHKPG